MKFSGTYFYLIIFSTSSLALSSTEHHSTPKTKIAEARQVLSSDIKFPADIAQKIMSYYYDTSVTTQIRHQAERRGNIICTNITLPSELINRITAYLPFYAPKKTRWVNELTKTKNAYRIVNSDLHPLQDLIMLCCQRNKSQPATSAVYFFNSKTWERISYARVQGPITHCFFVKSSRQNQTATAEIVKEADDKANDVIKSYVQTPSTTYAFITTFSKGSGKYAVALNHIIPFSANQAVPQQQTLYCHPYQPGTAFCFEEHAHKLTITEDNEKNICHTVHIYPTCGQFLKVLHAANEIDSFIVTQRAIQPIKRSSFPRE